MNLGDELELVVDQVVYRGSGLARHDGRVVFVRGVLPGEKIKVSLTRVKKSFAEAQLIEVIDASPDRITPNCRLPQDPSVPVPGCVYDHMSYEAEVAVKESQLQEQLKRFAGITDVETKPSVVSPESLHYRNKIALHSVMDGNVLGYFGEDNRTVVDVPQCPLAVAPINELLTTLRDDAEFRTRINRRSTVTLRWTEQDGALFWIGKPEVGTPSLTQSTPVGELRVSRRSFFQVNDAVATKLVTAVSEKLGAIAPQYVVDLYCGVGVFAFAAAQAGAKHVLGIESDTQAVRVAEQNAVALEISAEFVSGKCADYADSALERIRGKGATVVIDPPRTGLEPEVVKALLKNPPANLLYISCAPDTLGRDVRLLREGGFELNEVTMFDMFPRTAHFETLAWLSYRK